MEFGARGRFEQLVKQRPRVYEPNEYCCADKELGEFVRKLFELYDENSSYDERQQKECLKKIYEYAKKELGTDSGFVQSISMEINGSEIVVESGVRQSLYDTLIYLREIFHVWKS